ncbi:MAG: FmdB family transcriptional regulator [Truepera sp.]|nr:FmdB family transcriptional regulator [Truepera sp.]
MPIYLYRNLATGDTFEYEQKITEPAFTKHPETGEPVKRLIQPVGIVFKGSGFYVNDTRKSDKAVHKAKATDTDGKPTAKGDAAPAGSGSAPTSAPSTTSAAGTATDGA